MLQNWAISRIQAVFIMFYFFFLLFIGNNLKVKKCCKINAKNCCISIYPETHWSLTSCPSNIFFMAKGSNPVSRVTPGCHVSLISFDLGQWLSLFLTFMTLVFFKIADELLLRMSLQLGLSNVCPWLDSDYIFWARISQQWFWVPIASHPVGCDTNFPHLRWY